MEGSVKTQILNISNRDWPWLKGTYQVGDSARRVLPCQVMVSESGWKSKESRAGKKQEMNLNKGEHETATAAVPEQCDRK